VFGRFDLSPRDQIGLYADIWDCPIMPATHTVVVVGGDVDQPIANIEFRVGTKAIEPAVNGQGAPSMILRLQRGQQRGLWHVPEPMPAFLNFGSSK
jgi:hypothetical protein